MEYVRENLLGRYVFLRRFGYNKWPTASLFRMLKKPRLCLATRLFLKV